MSTAPILTPTSTPMSSYSTERPADAPPAGDRGPFVPILLVLIAFLSWTIFQTSQLISERGALNSAHADQTAQLAQSQKIRSANDSLAGKTQRLADSGNASAQLVIAQLKQRGITINPNAVTQAPPK